MKTTKAYLAGLGTTGILIGSVLILLVVGTGLVGFSGLPNLGGPTDPLERVVVAEDAQAPSDRDRSRSVGRLRAQRADRAAGQRAKAHRRAGSPDGLRGGGRRGARERLGGGAPGGGAPGAGDGGGGGGLPRLPDVPGGGGGGGGGSPLPPPVGGTVDRVTDTVGGAVEGATGVVGGTVEGATGVVGGTLDGVAPGAGAPVTEVGAGVGEVIGGTGEGVGGLLE